MGEQTMNAKSFATHGLAVLCGAVVASYLAFNFAAANLQRDSIIGNQRLAAANAQAHVYEDSSEVLAAKYRACVDQVKNFTGTETVLYEPQAPSLSVLRGAVRIEPGAAIAGSVQGPLKPKWIIGARITPLIVAENPGAAYAYIDKKTGQLSGPFQPASQP
jgi:hypothetical protein